MGTTLQGSQSPRSSISTTTVHLPSGEGKERWAIAPFGRGTYRSRAPARLSVAVTTFIWLPLLPRIFSENSTFCLSTQTRPDALGSHFLGCPPDTGTSQVSHSFESSTVVYAIRDPSGENTGLILFRPS